MVNIISVALAPSGGQKAVLHMPFSLFYNCGLRGPVLVLLHWLFSLFAFIVLLHLEIFLDLGLGLGPDQHVLIYFKIFPGVKGYMP